MPVAYLTTKGLKVALTSERLHVTVPTEREGAVPERRYIPLIDLEHVVVDSGISISTPAVVELLRKDIPLLFLSQGRFPAGVAVPINHSTTVLGCQLDACRDGAFRLQQAKKLVCAKINNQKRVLQRLAANRQESSLAGPWLNAIENQASAAQSLDSLRGLEGAAAGRYFEVLGMYFPGEFPFERRSRRPPHNPANSLLSFVYTLINAEIAMHLRAAGVEPGWGFYHETEDRRPSLALDLLEPFRAPVADALVLDLLNHNRFAAEDFDYKDGGCLLRRESRRKVFSAYELRMEREFLHEQQGHRTTLRTVLKDHVQQCKRAFLERVDLEPFIMN